ncbi:MAG: ABC transporter ATP-binding protein [Phycisphaerales bacterium]|nr:ABC transporter ATP-binding protein [Phycisphaerales bacterium]
MSKVEVEQLTKRFDTVTAVDAIDLEIESGELFFLLGPSGCGKTTLLRMIAGFVEPTAGRILVAGSDVTRQPPSRRGMAMVFQSYALWPHMTVRENVAYGLKIQKVDKQSLDARVDEALATVELDELAHRRPNALSGGQQQRVALARALVVRPRVLLLDEPLSNLDARLRQSMRAQIRRICKEADLTGIYVTHDQDEALSMADRIALLRDGSVVQCAPPEELYSKPGTRFAAEFLGDTNLISGQIEGPCEGGVRIQTPLGPLTAGIWSGSGTPTGEVMCSIRPESLLPATGSGLSKPGPNTVHLKCTQSVFLGERIGLQLAGPEGLGLQASVTRSSGLIQPGEAGLYSIDPTEVVIVDAT